MKYTKILLFAAAASLAFACGKTDYPEYEWGPKEDASAVKTEVYFTETSANLELEPSEESLTVELTRTETTEALSVPLIVKDPAGAFKVPATADFAAGEATTTIDIDLTGMELEATYELSISIPQDYYYLYKTSTAASAKTIFHLTALKQKWNDAGTCVFYDAFAWEDSELVYKDNIPIQNHDGTNDYRIIAPYATLFPDDFGDSPVNITFSIVKDEDGNNTLAFPSGVWNVWPGSGYGLYWNITNYSSYCYVDYDYNDGDYFFDVHILGANLNTGGLGTWGRFAFEWHDCPIEFPVPAAEPEEGGEEGGEESEE